MDAQKESKILEAAKTVFLRYGFRRVTMSDIAAEAGISRPALYLVFANKEEVFKAAVRLLATASLNQIRHGIESIPAVEARLKYAFEVWSVQPFELMASSPDAKDLIECGHGFAKELMDQINCEFEQVLTGILKPLVQPLNRKPAKSSLSAGEISRLLSMSVHGFKEYAGSAAQLRHMIADLLTLTRAEIAQAHEHPVPAK